MNPQNKKMVMMQKIFNPSQYRLSSGLGTLNKDNYARVMAESVNKAINPDEGPVKEKHVRRLLIASFQFESGKFFWHNLPVIRLKEHQVVCWKFCHVLHKMLRDGHRQVLVSCDERRQVLLDCGNLWRHIETGYGPLIHAYCELLFNRIKFLTKNPDFPNDLKLNDEQLDALEGQDPTGDLFFDLSCEIFDSIEDILRLQELVLASLEANRLNSMSSAGKCHLSPLVACIQDSSLFYDHAVKILFRLHSVLPSSLLEGHRGRFGKLHKDLKSFYNNTRNLQYFRTLIQIPNLSDRPPNFLIASELQQHVAPQVIMISENNERESPDQQTLVNLDEDDASSPHDDLDSTVSATDQQRIESDVSTSQSMAPDSSIDTIINASNKDEATTSTRYSDEEMRSLCAKIQELKASVNGLKDDLEREKSEHEKTKQNSRIESERLISELVKLRQDIRSVQYQLSSSKNAYDKLLEECERFKHDNEISHIAMKRMMKEMSELKTKQIDELQQVRQDASMEADAREEDLLMAEMNETDKIIKEATRKIEELSEKSRRIESGVKLQVNEKISEVCTNLMKAVRNLIAQSRLLQREIVATGDNGSTRGEFYKRNSSWTEGLISAANVVAMAAQSLVDAADRSMSNQAKFSELAAAAHEVAAATTQLVVASRVKANKDSEKLKVLTSAAKQVNQCTSNVVEASRVCAELVEQEVDKIDISTLSLHQTKKLEMETQVRLLELEESLTKERTKLGLLRRQHYEQEEAQAVASVVTNSSTSTN